MNVSFCYREQTTSSSSSSLSYRYDKQQQQHVMHTHTYHIIPTHISNMRVYVGIDIYVVVCCCVLIIEINNSPHSYERESFHFRSLSKVLWSKLSYSSLWYDISAFPCPYEQSPFLEQEETQKHSLSHCRFEIPTTTTTTTNIRSFDEDEKISCRNISQFSRHHLLFIIIIVIFQHYMSIRTTIKHNIFFLRPHVPPHIGDGACHICLFMGVPQTTIWNVP